jgi:hypothetical protein
MALPERISDTQLTRASVLLGFRFYIGEIRPARATVRGRAIPCSDCAQQRHDIIPNRVALAAEESVSGVTGATAPGQSGGPTHAHVHYRQ